MKKCDNCGRELQDDAAFCMYCGAKVVENDREKKKESSHETTHNKPTNFSFDVRGSEIPIIDFMIRLFRSENWIMLGYIIINGLFLFYLTSKVLEYSNPFVFLLIYIGCLALSLTIVGEWIIRVANRCRRIKRVDMLNAIEPCFNRVYDRAKEADPTLCNDIELFITNNKNSEIAYAIGRKTICITPGFISLPDNIKEAALAREFGHISNRDTDIYLAVYSCNIIFVIFHIVASILNKLTEDDDVGLINAFLSLFDLTIIGWTWLTGKLVSFGMKKQEYLADEFAFNLGYGMDLCQYLDNYYQVDARTRLGPLKMVVNSLPRTDDRIANLQSMGVPYSYNG